MQKNEKYNGDKFGREPGCRASGRPSRFLLSEFQTVPVLEWSEFFPALREEALRALTLKEFLTSAC